MPAFRWYPIVTALQLGFDATIATTIANGTRAAEDAFWWWFGAEGSELAEVFYDAELAIFS
ncbi:hypothetical protein [Rhizobium sp. 1399]|uniref:hypothetical protein n=1 Tax=Rhizobium sp. 1399 TaxID=2817758 RepID=UPI0028630381|nr:hypothetical protein [Rhizobium sp. 1399]MDR6668934.1 putative membrane protein [Rhizobium sp. 1399]